MQIKKSISAILLAICIFACGILSLGTQVQADAAEPRANIKSEFVDSLSELQETLGEDSPMTFIPLQKEDGLALVLRLNVKNDLSDLTSSLSKQVLAQVLSHLVMNNYYLAIGPKDNPSYIVDKSEEPVLNLQPIFDLITGSVNDLLKGINDNVQNGVSQKEFDMTSLTFANPEQEIFAGAMGFDFAQTTLYYQGTSPVQRPIGIDFYFTLCGNENSLSALEQIANVFQHYISLDELHYDFKNVDFKNVDINGDLNIKASIDYTGSPASVAAFATCAAYVTENAEIKADLLQGLRYYIDHQAVSQLKAPFDRVASQDVFRAINQFSAMSFDDMLKALNLDSDLLRNAANEFSDLAHMLNRIVGSLSLSAGAEPLGDHKKDDGNYDFILIHRDENGNVSRASFTINLFPVESDISSLVALIEEIEKLNPADYTTESWKTVKDALFAARNCTVKTEQSVIDSMLINLELAKKGLKSAPTTANGPDLLWLYITLPIVIVLIAGGVVAFFFLRRRKLYEDNTPIVAYDIDDDAPQSDAEPAVAVTDTEAEPETVPASETEAETVTEEGAESEESAENEGEGNK